MTEFQPFLDIKDAPPDPINGLDQLFRDDASADKINLVIGVYQDDDGHSPVLAAVKEAERRLLDTEQSKSYLPVAGEASYRKHTERLLFGDSHAVVRDDRLASLHTPGGTAALRVAADFVRDHCPECGVWISDPAYPNHHGIFGALGFALKDYRYYDTQTGALTFDAMLEDLSQAQPGDLVILHACCHNPSGADLDAEQWKRLADFVVANRLYPLVDFAYLGFAEGLDTDPANLRAFFDTVPFGMVSTSFSKNFALYGERTGMLTFVGADADHATRCAERSKIYTRRLYSSPPAHGGRIVATILSDDGLTRQWRAEVDEMRARLARMRKLLAARLDERQVSLAWFPRLIENRGMFALTRLDEGRIVQLRDEFHIYMLSNGRISIAGIREASVNYLADCFAKVIDCASPRRPGP